jgi:hypothetical protein
MTYLPAAGSCVACSAACVAAIWLLGDTNMFPQQTRTLLWFAAAGFAVWSIPTSVGWRWVLVLNVGGGLVGTAFWGMGVLFPGGPDPEYSAETNDRVWIAGAVFFAVSVLLLVTSLICLLRAPRAPESKHAVAA